MTMQATLYKSGEQVIPFQFDSANSFKHNLALVETDDIWSYIDRAGKVLWQERLNESEGASRANSADGVASAATLF